MRSRFRRSGPLPANIPKDVKSWDAPDGAPGSAFGYSRQDKSVASGLKTEVVFPGTYIPPTGAQYFFTEDDRTLAAGPITQVLTGTVFQVPVNNVAVIREFSFFVNSLLTTSDITFMLRINGAPVPGHTIKVFPRAVASVTVSFQPEDTLIPTPEGATLDFAVTVVDAIAYQLGANMRGWFLSKDTARRYGWPGLMV